MEQLDPRIDVSVIPEHLDWMARHFDFGDILRDNIVILVNLAFKLGEIEGKYLGVEVPKADPNQAGYDNAREIGPGASDQDKSDLPRFRGDE